MGIANGKDRDLLKKKIKEIKTGVEKEKKIQEKERKAKEKEQKKQLLKKKWGQPLRDWVTVSNIDSERAFYTVGVWYSSRSRYRGPVYFVKFTNIYFVRLVLQEDRVFMGAIGQFTVFYPVYYVNSWFFYKLQACRGLCVTERCLCRHKMSAQPESQRYIRGLLLMFYCCDSKNEILCRVYFVLYYWLKYYHFISI